MTCFSSWLRRPTAKEPVQRPTERERPALPSTQFALTLFEGLKPGHHNLVMSPYGARVVLSMLWEGSTGETRKELAEALRLDEDPHNPANHYERLGRPLGFQLELEQARRTLDILTACAVWCDDGFVPRPEYVAAVTSHFLADVRTLDFRAPQSADIVNRWVGEKTRGKISKVVTSLERSSPLMTMNAVYFKGLWQAPFDPADTQEDVFTLQDGTTTRVPLMDQRGSFQYAEHGGAQIVALPYKGEMSMRVVLPPPDMPFPAFCAELTRTVGTNWTRGMASRDGHVRLPRFRITTQADLKGPLMAMGMPQVFDPARATLDGISDRKPLYLMAAMQAGFVEVNETGTEAAALTTLEEGACMIQVPQPPFEMIINRPFVFAICDDLSDVVVFLGAVVDPLAGQRPDGCRDSDTQSGPEPRGAGRGH